MRELLTKGSFAVYAMARTSEELDALQELVAPGQRTEDTQVQYHAAMAAARDTGWEEARVIREALQPPVAQPSVGFEGTTVQTREWILENFYHSSEFPFGTESEFLIKELSVTRREGDPVPIYFADSHEAVYFLVREWRLRTGFDHPVALINLDAHDDYELTGHSHAQINEASWEA